MMTIKSSDAARLLTYIQINRWSVKLIVTVNILLWVLQHCLDILINLTKYFFIIKEQIMSNVMIEDRGIWNYDFIFVPNMNNFIYLKNKWNFFLNKLMIHHRSTSFSPPPFLFINFGRIFTLCNQEMPVIKWRKKITIRICW